MTMCTDDDLLDEIESANGGKSQTHGRTTPIESCTDIGLAALAHATHDRDEAMVA